jgi:hypothetical protein
VSSSGPHITYIIWFSEPEDALNSHPPKQL